MQKFNHEYILKMSSLIELMEVMENVFPHQKIQICKNGKIADQITYLGLIQSAKKKASLLKKNGLKPKDRVVLIEENSFEWLIYFFAILLNHATVIPIDAKLDSSDFSKLIAQSDPKLLLTGGKSLQKISKTFSFPILDIYEKSHDLTSNFEVQRKDSKTPLILFTSSTTGDFKGVIVSHQSILMSLYVGSIGSQISNRDRTLIILPLSHLSGMATTLISLINGTTVTLSNQLDSQNLLSTMQITSPTLFPVVPRVVELLCDKITHKINHENSFKKSILKCTLFTCKKIRSYTGWNLAKWVFSSLHRNLGGNLRYLLCTGAPLDPTHHSFMEDLGISVLQIYGLTETGIICSSKSGSLDNVGKPPLLSNIEIKITDQGEIYVKSPARMDGYFIDPISTEQAFDHEWFRTGDLGVIDKKGNLCIRGRFKEIIVLANGKKAMPEDVERRYKEISGIQEIAVFKHPSINQPNVDEIHAAVILSEKENEDMVREKILQKSEKVPSHLRIQRVHFVESIPKTSALKIKRSQLRKDILFQKEMQVDPTDQIGCEVEKQVIEIIRQIMKPSLKKKFLSSKTSFLYDLSFDSMDSLELASEIDKEFKICLIESDLQQIHTIEDLTKIVKDRKINHA